MLGWNWAAPLTDWAEALSFWLNMSTLLALEASEAGEATEAGVAAAVSVLVGTLVVVVVVD